MKTIYVEVKGGVVQVVGCDQQKVDVILVDWDNKIAAGDVVTHTEAEYMSREEMEAAPQLNHYVGRRLYAQVSRMGGKGRDIDCIVVYELTPQMTMQYIYEAVSIVATKAQCAYVDAHMPHRMYGRPTVARLIRLAQGDESLASPGSTLDNLFAD